MSTFHIVLVFTLNDARAEFVVTCVIAIIIDVLCLTWLPFLWSTLKPRAREKYTVTFWPEHGEIGLQCSTHKIYGAGRRESATAQANGVNPGVDWVKDEKTGRISRPTSLAG